MSSRVTNEPMSKRQRIDSVSIVSDSSSNNDGKHAFTIVSNGDKHNENAPPDILSATSTTFASSANVNGTIINNGNPLLAENQMTDTNVPHNDNDELDNASTSLINQKLLKTNGIHSCEFPDLLKTSNHRTIAIATTSPPTTTTSTTTTISSTSIKPSTPSTNIDSSQPSCSTSPQSSRNNHHNHLSLNPTKSSVSENNLDEFQLHLMKQCLCDINDRLLRRPFESYYYKDQNGIKHSMPLYEWPTTKLIQFLSNIQLLFDVYLKQNAKGQICTRIMQVCDALVYNEHNIIDDIFNLYEYNNKFVQFLAGRIIASCMVIAKDKKDLYENWLITIVANLVIDRTQNEHYVLQKITFSLEIILRILEWRDYEEHPLENTVIIDGRTVDTTTNEQFTLPVVPPPIENNYFAMNFNADATSMGDHTIPPMTSQNAIVNNQQQQQIDRNNSTINEPILPIINTCQLQTLSDSESFDTTDLKCNVVNALKNKWSHLVDSVSGYIIDLHCNHNKLFTENTILTFLTLWERIISVQANLSVDSTLPFHEKLTTILDILIKGNLSVPIYRQILTLFNESLCYGTTLALQSVLPEETNRLANEIFNGVKSQRIFNSLPVQQRIPENDVSFIGYKRTTVTYPIHRIINNYGNDNNSAGSLNRNHFLHNNHTDTDDNVNDDDDVDDVDDEDELDHNEDDDDRISSDYILLQKLVLLILKAIAVTVKPVRGDDSSDSSMDGCNSNSSTDYEAYQATVQIERATRDVLKKLNQFMKNKLNHHPGTHFSKMIVHLFADQDDYLVEAMVCMLDTTTAFMPRLPLFSSSSTSSTSLLNERNQFRALKDMLSPVFAFLEFLDLISNKTELLLDMLVSNETCFLLYLLRLLKYVRSDWETFAERCNEWSTESGNNGRGNGRGFDDNSSVLDRTMAVLIRLRLLIERLVLQNLYPYDISPIIDLLRQCESLYEGNDTDLF